MRKALLSAISIFVYTCVANAQTSIQVFDTIYFNKQLEFVNHLIEYEFYTQLAVDKFNKMPETSGSEWYSYQENNTWHSIGGNTAENTFVIKNHVIFDSLNMISDYSGISDTTILNALGSALSISDTQFQNIRDTSSIYFNSFLISNDDQTISAWYLPAFQPSGQAIYGCEWEYIFDKTGKNMIRKNSYTKTITGIWVGQPRELWLNYRSTDKPTIGSIFFAQSFRDYFTRLRIDTRISISTTAKDRNGNYAWTHKMK
jgi:hypothetical protein